jgi:hypothetical protein
MDSEKKVKFVSLFFLIVGQGAAARKILPVP